MNMNEIHDELISYFFRSFKEKGENKCIEDFLNITDYFFPMFLNFESIFIEKKVYMIYVYFWEQWIIIHLSMKKSSKLKKEK